MNQDFQIKKFQENSIVIYGIGGHAGMCIDVLIENNHYEIVGFIDDNVKKDYLYGLKYLGDLKNLNQLIKDGLKNFIIGIGFLYDLNKRNMLYQSLKDKVNIPTIIHHSAIIENSSKIGNGCQIFAGSIIGSNVKINDNCIVNIGANVSHDTTLETSVHLTPNVTIAGHAKIGKEVFIGANSTILPTLEIGSGALIGAGSVVTKNVSRGSKIAGNPARVLK
jgi:sugar O-acyltransferase (sialic acid O-acetyltransferase NeuD family)